MQAQREINHAELPLTSSLRRCRRRLPAQTRGMLSQRQFLPTARHAGSIEPKIRFDGGKQAAHDAVAHGLPQTVRPREKACGWLTCGDSEMVTVRFPCATATVDTRTSRPMTMMPERSSMTIFAASSGSTCSCSISVNMATRFCGNFCGSVSCTVEGSSGSATGTPR